MDIQAHERVLLVDDDPRALKAMSRALAGGGIACVTAGSAGDALALLRSRARIDVVLSDIYMPSMDGIEFLGAVRREFADRPWLQLLLVTGQASVTTAVAAMRLDASDYLIKPVEPTPLREAVGHALARAESIRRVRHTALDTPQAAELQRVAAAVRDLALELRQADSATTADRGDLRTLHLLQRLQDARESIFRDAVMPEPAWEMLAELMRARLAGQQVSVTSLAMASKSPTTTALRRIEDLLACGLVARVPDPDDRRRTYVELTPEGLARMQLFLEGFGRLVPGPQ